MSPWSSLPRKQKARQKPRKEHDKILESTTKSFLRILNTENRQLLLLEQNTRGGGEVAAKVVRGQSCAENDHDQDTESILHWNHHIFITPIESP
jgi:hypothetical protein